ncbi:hypothetical protein [Streptomyces sp. NPDC088350]|uniref:hypothetical protein n=1 Tax=Streptomyces sp. NPDC088350 TaxID=3365854 RepID=UPI00382E1CE7
MRASRTAGAGASVALLFATLTSCGGAAKTPSITAPEVFYLRPVGDTSGPHDKTPFHLSTDDGTAHAGGRGTGGHTLTADVLPGAETAVVLRRSGNCTGGPTHVTCEVGPEYDNWSDAPRVTPVAAKVSKPGDAGVVRLELAAGGLEFEEQYANCRYPDFSHGHIAVCMFPDLRIAPGQTVAIRPAVRLRVPEAKMYVSVGSDVNALEPGEIQTFTCTMRLGDPGEGTLTLQDNGSTDDWYVGDRDPDPPTTRASSGSVPRKASK